MTRLSQDRPRSRKRSKSAERSNLQQFISLLAESIGYTGQTALSDLKDISVDPHTYLDPAKFRTDYLFASLVRKYPDHDVKVDRSAAARESFLEAEQRCYALNNSGYTIREQSSLTAFDCVSLMNRARSKIEYILGVSPDLSEIASLCSYSTGASVKHKRAEGDQYYKFGVEPHVTLNAKALFKKLTAGTLYERLWPTIETATFAKCDYVPKSWKTDRLICKEPHGNMYIQKGIGSYIRKALRRVGINLNDQTINQRFAKDGSIDGVLSTIDLKAASDSISLRLCRDLLPLDWYHLLLMARSEVVDLDGTLVELEKISAMGNGFTFELESLIFYGLVSACREEFGTTSDIVSVYGDDIVCNTSYSGHVIDLLYYAGFETNIDKTFVSSMFRESCGKHYFAGVDVTPVYVKRSFNEETTVILLANSIREWLGGSMGLILTTREPYDFLVQLLPKWLRKPKLPLGFGDSALTGTFEEVQPKFCKKLFVWKTSRVPVAKSIYRDYDTFAWSPSSLKGFLLKRLSVDSHNDCVSTIRPDIRTGVNSGKNEVVNLKLTVPIWSDPAIWV